MDHIARDVMWGRLIAAVNEQAAALIRSSFTSIVREAGDLSACVFDEQGRMLAQAVTGTPGHINSMASGMKHIVSRFSSQPLLPGDVVITNDPWITASQLNDITVATPVHHNNRLVGYFANCCHALDIGGKGLSADARSIYEEGLHIPVMKLMNQGKPVQPVFDFIAANVRTPDEVLGDLHAQISANNVGARQLSSFMHEFQLQNLQELADSIINSTELAMRNAIRSVPNSENSFSITIDGFDEPIVIRIRIIVKNDEMSINYNGTSKTLPLGVNVGFNYTLAYTTYGVKCAVAPNIPNNEGSFRPLHVSAPKGCILHAVHPDPVAGRHTVGHHLPAAVMGALSSVLPDAVVAPGSDGLWNTHISGYDPHKQSHFSYTWFSSGGVGAMRSKDGFNATSFPSGVAGVPVEVMETIAPIIVHQRSLRQDSGGAGRSRGGLGQTISFQVRTDRPFSFAGLFERCRHPAPGLMGGKHGAPGEVSTSDGTPLAAKITSSAPHDSVVTLNLPGGGGFGNPTERDPELVRQDVLDEYVSPEAAERDYGVRIDPTSHNVQKLPSRKS